MNQDHGKEMRRVRAALDRYRVTSGKHFDLDAHESDDLPESMPDKHEATALLKRWMLPAMIRRSST